MFNKNKVIREQELKIDIMKHQINLWVEANNAAEDAWDMQQKLVETLNETIKLHKQIKEQDKEIIQLLEEIVEEHKISEELKDIRIEQLLEQNIGMIK